jgi:plastocyanin
MRSLLLLALLGATANTAGADDHVIAQSGKKFSVTALTAKVGDTLTFRNDDPFVHNIFSLSDLQSFDLGTFAKGELRHLKLVKPGTLEIECAVHPDMRLVVEIK